MTRPILAAFVLALTGAGCAHAPAPAPQSLAEVPAESLYRRGLALAEQGDFVPAEQYFQAARSRGYPEAQAVKQLVKVCLAGNRFDSALHYALPYLERHPDAWPLRQVVATIHLAMGDGEAARMELEDMASEVPDHPDVHYLLAVVMRDEFGDVDGAERSFGRYLTLAPDGEHAPEVRAWIRRKQRAVAPEVTQ